MPPACKSGTERIPHGEVRAPIETSAHCAGVQGKFWEYHDAAFERQPKFSPESLLNIAKKLKLDLPAFQACIGSEETKKFIASDLEQGTKANVLGTPSVFINGRMFPNWISKQLVQQTLDKILSENK